jgi:transposase-like protein
MERTLHGSARTTPAIRLAIQQSQESLLKLAERYHINPKTVAKWRNRTTTADDGMGPPPWLSKLTIEQEALIVAFRRHTLLPLADCLSALQNVIPHLSRSTLHRCFHRHAINRLPPAEDEQPGAKQKFTDHPLGFLRVDCVTIWIDEWQKRLELYVAIDRGSKVMFAELHAYDRWLSAVDFLERVLEKMPYQIHTVLTDKRLSFTSRKYALFGPTESDFLNVCRTHKAKHWRVKPTHCWNTSQIENMGHTLRGAIDLNSSYQTTDELNQQLQTFLLAYNHTTRLTVLQGLTPHEFICSQWQNNPAGFDCDPTHLPLGLAGVIPENGN